MPPIRIAMIVLALMTGAADAATTRQGTIESGGIQRSYTLYLPANFDTAKRYPIVLGLHGGLGNGKRFAQQSGLPAQIDRGNFIAVFPDSNGKQWNDGRVTTRTGTDDVAFLVRLIEQVASENGGDPQRVFVTGVSNGGMMAQRLICETSVVAAAAVVIANMPADLAGTCLPKRPAPIVFFNGVADPLMPWAGGEIRKAPGLGVGGKAMSTPQTVAFWARTNGCRGERVEGLPNRAEDGTRVKRHSFENCAGAAVQLYEIEGGGHTWPGGAEPKLDIVRRIVGTTSKDIDATQAMIEFFSKFGL